MLRGDGNENGQKKSISPIKPGPPMRKFHSGLQEVVDVRTYRRTIFAELNLLDALTTKFS